MIQGELNRLRESYSFPAGIQIRLPKVDETIMSTRQSEVAFNEAAFQAGLRLPIHPTIRRISYYYNTCLAQQAPNGWRSVVCTGVLWRFHKQGRRRPGSEGIPGMSRVGRRNSSSSRGTSRSASKCYSGCWGSKNPEVMEHPRSFALDSKQMASNGRDNVEDKPVGGATPIMGDEGESHHSRDDPPRGDHSRDGSVEYTENPSAVEKLLEEVISLADMGGYGKIGSRPGDRKVLPLCRLVGSEMAHTQWLAKELKRQVAELKSREQHAIEKIRWMKEDRDAIVERLEKEVIELKEKETLAKKSAIEEYKFSYVFQEVVE
ncbi:hypothetical protein Acr_00g0055190 [Actinidia rufa]|uniref:Uncharacterized protein n=1 Tax=Actinidia rufa TaxID=165716 RepID=A0A7J0DLU4_9ERIC|nr:hypothetical protein Acr_00g0055190 [Actinidia rufa]